MNLRSLIKYNFGERTINQINNIVYSGLYKFFGVILNFLSVPIFLKYLNSSNYGVWLTISSILSWISLLDLGIGNGLKNKLCENIVKGNLGKSKSLVSTSYFIFFVIALVLVVLFCLINTYIDWSLVFNTSDEETANLKILMPILVIFFSTRFILDLVNSVFYANQRADIVARNNFIINLFVFVGIYFLSKTEFENKLYWLNIVSNGIPIVSLFVISLYSYNTRFIDISPNWRDISFANSLDILSIGLKFFIIQVSSLIIFSTDNIIINALFSPSDVTIYNIPYKLFSSFIFAWTIILTPLWTAFNDAYLRNDFIWIKKVVLVLNYAWLFLAFFVILTLIFSTKIYLFWIGPSVFIPSRLTFFMAIFILLSTYSNIYVYFMNGIGKIKIQFYISIFAAIINIPLCIFFVKILGMGVDGIILATSLSISLNSVVSLYQYYLIVNKKAVGIWFS